MFELFKTKRHHFVGVDFGTSAIKIVELSFDGEKIQLENYGWVDLEPVLNADKGLPQMQTYEVRMRKYLQLLLEKLSLDEKQAYVAIPGFSGLITLVEFPEMNAEELEKAIHFESHKYIPSSIEEIAMSWEVVGKKEAVSASKENGGVESAAKLQILLVAAPKKEIAKYEKLMEGSGIEIAAIELETFSIARAVLDKQTKSALIMDIGSRSTNIILVENGIVKINRNIDIGGNEVASAIAESLSISPQRATVLKQGEKDLLNGRDAIIIPALEMIMGETLRILNSYKEKNSEFKVEEVFVSGGVAKMKGLGEYAERMLGLKISLANPWRNITFDEKLKSSIEEMNASFAVALGLALRGIEDSKNK